MISMALGVLLSHWRQHPFQLLTLVVGLALATGLWVAVQAINSEARASYSQVQTFSGQMRRNSIVAKTGEIQLIDYVELRKAGWQVSPVLEGHLRIGSQHIDFVGVDLLNYPLLNQLEFDTEQSVNLFSFSKMLLPPGVMIMHPETARQMAPDPLQPTIWPSESIPVGTALADISIVSRLLNKPNKLTRLVFFDDQMPDVVDGKNLPAHLRLIKAAPDNLGSAQLTKSFHLNLTAFGFLSFAVGLFIVQGTVSLALEQRRGMMRTLRCLGLSRLQLIKTLAVELIIITLIASTTGLVLGYFLAAFLLPEVSATLSGLYGADVDSGLSLRWDWIVSGLAMALLGAVAASAQAFLTLWKLPVLQLSSTQARGQQVLDSFWKGAFLGAGLILIGGAVLFFGQSLLGGFIFLAGLMLGSAMILPFFVNLLLRFGQARSRRPLTQWLWADSRAQLPGLSLSLMALMLALATNIGVGTMVSSFRLTFHGWLDQRLPAELYVTATSDEQGDMIEQWLTRKGHRVLPIRFIEVELEEQNLKIYGIRDDATYRENWPILSATKDSWDHLATGRGILINEQLSHRENLTIGDHLELPQGWPSEILGVYSDYGNPNGQAMVSLPTLLQAAPQTPNLRFGVRLSSDELSETIQNLKQVFEIPQENISAQAGIKEKSLAVFDQTFVVTSALNLLTLGVAGFSILTSLATLWQQRLPQLAPIWAMGVSRRTLAIYDILRSLLIASLTALFALPLGLLLAWVLLDVINREAFGWRLPMYLFPGQWLQLVSLALIAAVLAALISAWRLFRLMPNDLLKVFSNDR